MKNKIILLIIAAIFCAVSFTSCLTTSTVGMVDADTGKTAAIVSLTIGMYDGNLTWNLDDPTVKRTIDSLLPIAEQQIAKRWTLIPTASYVDKPAYKAIQGASDLKVVIPSINGSTTSVLAETREQLIKSFVAKEKIVQLADVIQADYLIVIYTEWAVATGSFIPTSKPVAKNVISIYDATGVQLFNSRNDHMTDKTLGAFGKVVVNPETVGFWREAYQESFMDMFN